MSVFSVLRRGRQAAKEHNAKQAEQKRKEEEKTPYKHIPTHAAIDALSGGPSSSRDVDRPRILEQNRRRSAMSALGLGMGGSMTAVNSSLPRTHSSLSHVSFPTAYASPMVQLPRSYSYSGMPPPTWATQGAGVRYHSPGASSRSLKGKGVERVIFDSGHLSRTSSCGSGVKDDSSGESSASQEDLEMKPTKPTNTSPPSSCAALSRDSESLHRMHPRHPRRLSDPTRLSVPPRHPHMSSRDRTSQGSALISSDIPPVPPLPSVQFTSTANSSSTSSTTSIASMTTATPNKPSPPSSVHAQDEAEQIAIALSDIRPARHSRRTSKVTRFSRLETISSNISEYEESMAEADIEREDSRRPKVMASTLPTHFDESSLPPPREIILSAEKPSKLTKAPGSRLVKRNRWSLRGGRNQAVAV